MCCRLMRSTDKNTQKHSKRSTSRPEKDHTGVRVCLLALCPMLRLLARRNSSLRYLTSELIPWQRQISRKPKKRYREPASHYSAPLTHFCQLIIEQLSDPTFANLQTFCIPCQLDMSAGSDQIQFFSRPPERKNRVSLLICLGHLLSHGSVHITSADPLTPPRIDPRYFRNGADAKILAIGLK